MRLVVALVLVGLSLPAAAQSGDFVPGYVVARGDTLRGAVAVGSETDATPRSGSASASGRPTWSSASG